MKIFSHFFELLIKIIFIVSWFAGVVYAVSWFKFLAVIFPPYAMYLVVEKLMIINGLV